MAVKIRLKRGGKKGQPSYRIVAINSQSKRDGQALEVLGQYNPQSSTPIQNLKEDRIKYWLSVGAQCTDVICKLLVKTGLTKRVEKKFANPGISRKDLKVKVEAQKEASKAAAKAKKDTSASSVTEGKVDIVPEEKEENK